MLSFGTGRSIGSMILAIGNRLFYDPALTQYYYFEISLREDIDCQEETIDFYKHPCIECGKTKHPIIGQCEKCGGPIRGCCTGHLARC